MNSKPEVTTERSRRMVVVTETNTTWFWTNDGGLISFNNRNGAASQISAGSESVWLNRKVIHLFLSNSKIN